MTEMTQASDLSGRTGGGLTADVLIVGGGMVGLSLALALSPHFSVCVVDAVSPETATGAGFDGRVTAVAYSSCRMWRALGLWSRMAVHAQPINDIVVSDGRRLRAARGGGAAPGFLHFDHREIGDEPLGHLIENRFIRKGLHAELKTRDRVRIIAPAKVLDTKTDGQGVTARLSTGRTVRAPLCIAADGRNSPLREAARIRTTSWSYPQSGIVTTVDHERPHDGVAQEYFLPSGPFAILPMTGNRSSLVWTEQNRLVPDYLALSDADFGEQVQLRFGPYLGRVTPVGPRWSYPLALHFAERYVAPRLALIGDAAHGIHPIAGQGFNLGLRDVAALAEVLVEAKASGQDLGLVTVLERYQRWRRFDNLVLAGATDVFNRLFSNAFGPIQAARRLGLAVTDQIAPARRFFMRHAGGAVAMGGEGALPKLLRGEPLN